jgi:chromosome segregation ATPase
MSKIVPSRLEIQRAKLQEELYLAQNQLDEAKSEIEGLEGRIEELETDAHEAIRLFLAEVTRPCGRLTFIIEDSPAVQRALLALDRAVIA